MYSEFSSDVQFFFVYGKEAHPIDSERPKAGTTVEQPVTTEERLSVAKDFVADIEMTIPTLLDKIDNKTATDYASIPDRLYLVGKAILAETGSKKVSKATTQKTQPNNARQNSNPMAGRFQSMMSRIPALKALDANQDGKISNDEIENASAALKSLDQNEDGRLDANELRPERPQRRQRRR